jgi:hypothetical protein
MGLFAVTAKALMRPAFTYGNETNQDKPFNTSRLII